MLPQPYDGNKPYIFISYAHRDSARALPIIERLCAQGYRVWYDQGIDPGTEWDENIAEHVENCGCFVALLSEHYLQSNNCKDELNFARDCEKERLIVYLEDVQLPKGLAMRINRLQAIFKYTYETDEAFFEKLFSTPSLTPCGGAAPIGKSEPQMSEPQKAAPASLAKPSAPPSPALTWASFFACTVGAVAAVVFLLTDPDGWFCLVPFAVALFGGCTALSTTRNRVLGLLCNLFVLTGAVCINMWLFFPLELWGVLIGAPLCSPFVAYAFHWWEKR